MLPTIEHTISRTDAVCSHVCHFGCVWVHLPAKIEVLFPAAILYEIRKDIKRTLPIEGIEMLPYRNPRHPASHTANQEPPAGKGAVAGAKP